jgi:hypothetical protein
MASNGDLIIESVDTESGGCPTSLNEPSVYIVNSNYNPEVDFEEVDLPIFTSDSKDELSTLAPDSHLAAKEFESQYKHQHQTYSTSKKNLGHFNRS